MIDPLGALLRRTEWPEPVFGAGELSGWPADARDLLERLGLLVEAEPARVLACDSCGRDHVERVEWWDGPGRSRRAFLFCSVVGRVPVDPGRLRRWTVALPRLARLVAQAIGTTGSVTERASQRIWKLGLLRVSGQVWTAFLGLGLAGPDGPALVAQVPDLRAPNALLFIPTALPSAVAQTFDDRLPAVVGLADLVTLADAGLIADRSVLESALTPSLDVTTGAAASSKAGSWTDVVLIVEARHLRVRVEGIERRVGFARAGFADRRRKDMPNRTWELLSLLARRGGVLESPDRITTKSDALKRGMTRLRERLRALTGLSGDPFHPVGRGGTYRTRLTIRSAEGVVVLTPSGTTWEQVSLIEIEPGVVDVVLEAQATGVAFARGEDDGLGRWEATTEFAERTVRYPIAELGLTKPGQDALLALLRCAGTLRRRDTDPGMLSLGKGLSRILPIPDPPFEFRGGTWTTRFEARSLVPSSDR